MALVAPSLRSGLKLRSVARGVASLSAARLSYPGGAPTQPLCLDIQRPASGGHILLGGNGHGKTLVAQALLDDSLVLSGELKRPGRGARVSFESHLELLAKGGTVYKALGYGGTLSAAAKYLTVRFGLHPLLYRPVRSISTGEIRKVLLARALATRPSLLVLDNAFDGLDGPSREVRTPTPTLSLSLSLSLTLSLSLSLSLTLALTLSPNPEPEPEAGARAGARARARA